MNESTLELFRTLTEFRALRGASFLVEECPFAIYR